MHKRRSGVAAARSVPGIPARILVVVAVLSLTIFIAIALVLLPPLALLLAPGSLLLLLRLRLRLLLPFLVRTGRLRRGWNWGWRRYPIAGAAAIGRIAAW
jgi:hypothetical protein